MKTNVITPRNNRIISASHLSCSQPLLLLLSLCNVKTFGEAAAGAGAGAVHHCTTIWRGHTLNVAQPEASPSTSPCAHHQSRSTEYTTTPHRVSPLRTPGVLCPAGPRQGELWCWCVELWCWCVVLCCVVLCYGGVAVKINCVVLCDVSRQLIAAGPRGRTTQSLVYSLQPGSGSGGGSSHTGSGHTRHASM